MEEIRSDLYGTTCVETVTIASPISIIADRTKGILSLVWPDGHASDIPFELLRVACPCASCRGGHENMRSEPDPEVFDMIVPPSNMTRVSKVEPVGSYGLTFEWEDGHHYGIYNWKYLRALCPCTQCRGGSPS